MTEQTTIVFNNYSLETRVKFIGYLSILIFVLLTVQISPWFIIGILCSSTLLFPTAGTSLNKETKTITQFLIIFTFKHLKKYEIDNSYEVVIIEDNPNLKPLIQRIISGSTGTKLHSYGLLIESKSSMISLSFPLNKDKNEVEKIGRELSETLNIKLRKVHNTRLVKEPESR